MAFATACRRGLERLVGIAARGSAARKPSATSGPTANAHRAASRAKARGSPRARALARWPWVCVGATTRATVPMPADASSLASRRWSVARPKAIRSRQVLERAADADIIGVVDGGLGAQGAALLDVLLDARVLVGGVNAGVDAADDHPGRKTRWRAFGDAAVEQERDLVGSAEVKVIAIACSKKARP